MDLLIGVVFVLGVMILVHEWGHFIVARLFRVRVDVFSIGFGPRLFGWKRGATDYRVSALPLGGYVRMAGQDLSEVDSGDKPPTGAPDELMSKPRWQRALISLAGPVMNLILPIFLLAGLYLVKGEAYPPYWNQPAQIVSQPASTGPDALRAGDKLLSIGSILHPTWEQAEQFVSTAAPSSTIPVKVENNGVERSINLHIPEKDNEQFVKVFGYPPVPPIIDEVGAGSPAERAGLLRGDKIIAIDGHEVQWWGQFVGQFRSGNGAPIKLKIERASRPLDITVKPEKMTSPSGETAYMIGIGSQLVFRRMPFKPAVVASVGKTGETIGETIDVVGKLFSGKASLKQMYGPVGISRAAGEATRQGPVAVILLMVLISINLGILNLLPIPILDGGHILLLAIEGGMRRDLSLAFKERFVQVGLVFLLVVFAIVMYNDVVRLLPIHS